MNRPTKNSQKLFWYCQAWLNERSAYFKCERKSFGWNYVFSGSIHCSDPGRLLQGFVDEFFFVVE